MISAFFISPAGVASAAQVAVVVDDRPSTTAVVERTIAPSAVTLLAVGIQDRTVVIDVPAGLLVVSGRPLSVVSARPVSVLLRCACAAKFFPE